MPLRFGLLGDPVEHSRSPEIHRVLLGMAGLVGEYVTVRSDAAGLRTAVSELRAGEWDGLNVTMPLKGDAFSAVDRLTLVAEKARSVNTLSNVDGEVVGETTDALTIGDLVETAEFHSLGSVLVLGAGGSAAAAMAGVGSQRRLYISARRSEQSAELGDRLGGEAIPWGTAVAGALVVNATPIGMHGETLPDDVVAAAGGIIDLAYARRPTPTVRQARARFTPVVDGTEFLLRQAVRSFAIWTGLDFDVEQVRIGLRKP